MEIITLYPFRKCRYEINEGLVTLLFKNPKPSFIDRTFFKKSLEKDIKVDLDEIGSFIWLLCDGKITVNEIILIARDKFQDKIEPAEQRIVKFINQMVNKKFIRLYEKI